jgi:FkbM family methyltransferase
VAGRLLVPDADEMITPVMRRDGAWEAAETRFLLSELRPGMTFVDVGAHVGYFSVLAARSVGASGTVIAIEPEPRNLDLLRINLARNDCANAFVLPVAAHSEPGSMSLALDEQNRGGHRLVPLGEAATIVRCVRLDDVLPAKVDVVKIDAQGYDHEVVAGLTGTLAANPQLIVIAELSLSELGRLSIDPGLVLSQYKELGLTISTFEDSGGVRRTSAKQILSDCRAGRFPSDFSLILQRPHAPSAAREGSRRPRAARDGRHCPTATASLQVTEREDGLIVSEAGQGRTHHLNETAALVFELCTGKNTIERIVEVVQQAYELAEPPSDDVKECLDHLRSEGLVA